MNFKDYIKGPAGERWEQALERFRTICHMDIVQYVDDDTGEPVILNLSEFYDEGLLYEIHGKEHRENIQKCEARFGMTVPHEVVHLLCEHGAFAVYMVSVEFGKRWGERTFLYVHCSKDPDLYTTIEPLCRAIANYHGGTYFEEDSLSAAEIKSNI